MVFSAVRVLLGGTSFSAREAQFMRSAVRQGFSRQQTRDLMRDSFGRGFSNAAFTEMRQQIASGLDAGIALRGLEGRQRLDPSEITQVVTRFPLHRFVVTTKVRTIIPRTGTVLERFVRFGTDEVPSPDLVRARAQEIIDSGISQVDSAMEIEDFEDVSIIEQVTV